MIADVLKMPHGTAVEDFYATLNKIHSPKKIEGQKGSFSVQDLILSDESGDEIVLSTYGRISPDCVGQKVLVEKAVRHDWGDRVNHKTLRGRIKFADELGTEKGKGKVNKDLKPNQEKSIKGKETVNADTTWEKKDLRMAWESAIKSSVTLITGVAPLCQKPEDILEYLYRARKLVAEISEYFVSIIYSKPDMDRYMCEIEDYVSEHKIPSYIIKKLTSDFGVQKIQELSSEQKKELLGTLKDFNGKFIKEETNVE